MLNGMGFMASVNGGATRGQVSRPKTNAAATTHGEPGQRQENTITESQTPRGIPIAIQHLG